MDLSKTEKIDCPLCAHVSYQQKHQIDSWKIVQCDTCAFVYVNPRLQKQELLKIYSSNYFDNKEFGYYHYTENKELRKRNFQKWIKDALPYFSSQSNTKALDVGCAAGYCLEVFDKYQWTPFGIELDKNLAGELQQKGFVIFETPLIYLKTIERFNLITLFDVIEHLTDLPKNMATLYSLLEDDGIVVLVTPNYESWQRKIFEKKWFQFKPVEHINYFSLSTLKKLASDNGFEFVCSKNSGQFCDTIFLENRLMKYKFKFLLPLFHLMLRLFKLKGKYFYVDTASLYVILKKRSVQSTVSRPIQPL